MLASAHQSPILTLSLARSPHTIDLVDSVMETSACLGWG